MRLIGNGWLSSSGFLESTNSTDAVADRDFMIEFISTSAILMGHLSRFCEELVLWASPMLGFIHIGDAFTTGSSLMPQKKIPDIAELIRGKESGVGAYHDPSYFSESIAADVQSGFARRQTPTVRYGRHGSAKFIGIG